jgi:hypothetical protein
MRNTASRSIWLLSSLSKSLYQKTTKQCRDANEKSHKNEITVPWDVTIKSMATESIVALLIAEREKLERAIAALQAGGAETGNLKPAEVAPEKKRHISAATRRKIALGQLRRQTALKAAKR